ncbi:unnamed protein product [Caenorhabditis auriculariae]|uniref:Uncharacterized protein n=1 Tax=Caenorhabditis auriculariae TaxID=2777116 RepID=A0A8S1HR50_9PELO|nr:unnamed protein product [Caenorhabditis auriculariae]
MLPVLPSPSFLSDDDEEELLIQREIQRKKRNEMFPCFLRLEQNFDTEKEDSAEKEEDVERPSSEEEAPPSWKAELNELEELLRSLEKDPDGAQARGVSEDSVHQEILTRISVISRSSSSSRMSEMMTRQMEIGRVLNDALEMMDWLRSRNKARFVDQDLESLAYEREDFPMYPEAEDEVKLVERKRERELPVSSLPVIDRSEDSLRGLSSVLMMLICLTSTWVLGAPLSQTYVALFSHVVYYTALLLAAAFADHFYVVVTICGTVVFAVLYALQIFAYAVNSISLEEDFFGCLSVYFSVIHLLVSIASGLNAFKNFRSSSIDSQ